MSFSSWIEGVVSSPILLLLTLLTLGVIFVNGWTDAPNAIASCVATRALSPRTAIGMAAVCNFLGLILTVSVNSAVTDTVFTMVKFSDNEQESQIALCAAMAAIVLWACAAWYFGIPTSESHALIAGITGAALALGEEGGMRFSVWSRVLLGLAFSVISGFCLGWICVKIILKLAKNAKRDAAKRVLRRLQILSGAANAFLHGSQDGQKFIGVLLLSVAAAKHTSPPDTIPFWMILLCSVVLSLGTALGGNRIIRAVGMKMLRLEDYQGVAADAAAAIGLGICTVYGLPVSTTHAKTTAIMGAGAATRIRAVNWSVAKQMVLAWGLTFPGCGLMGFLAARLGLTLCV